MTRNGVANANKIVALIIGLLTIAGVVFAAARIGVSTETSKQIEKELMKPDGAIYQKVDHMMHEHIGNIEKQLVRVETRQESVREQLDRIERKLDQ